MEDIIFLDAQTPDEELRITSFGDTVLDVLKDFRNWVIENEITELDYADIFAGSKKPNHIAKVFLNDDGSIEIEATPSSKLNPFKREQGFLPSVN